MTFNALHLAIVLFLAVGAVFGLAPILMSLVLAPRAKGGDLGLPYECGMLPRGRAWNSFPINYYVYALIFIAFDVDVLYLFPVALGYKLTPGLFPLWEVTFFLFFVLLAMLYFQAKGVFSWPRRLDL